MVTGSAKRALGRPGRGTPPRRRRCYARRPRGARVVGRCPSSISFPNPRARTQRCAPGTPQTTQCPRGSRADRTGRAPANRATQRATTRCALAIVGACRKARVALQEKAATVRFFQNLRMRFLRATFANGCLGVARPRSPRHRHHRAGSMVPCGMCDRLTFVKSV